MLVGGDSSLQCPPPSSHPMMKVKDEKIFFFFFFSKFLKYLVLTKHLSTRQDRF